MTSTEPSEGTSTTSDFDRMTATESAVNILAQGKRNMVCGEIPTAVNQFQEACKLLAKAYGETAKECADAYFCYGQALLDLARMENGVLGNALQGVPDTDEEESSDQKSDQFEKVEMEADEREKLRQEVYDAMSEKEKTDAEKKKAGETVEVAMDTEDSSSKPAEKGDDEKGEVKDVEKDKDDKEKSEKVEGKEDKPEDKPEEKKAKSEEEKVEEKDVGKCENKEAKADNKEASKVDNKEANEDGKTEADKIVQDEAKGEDKAVEKAKTEDEGAKPVDKDLKIEDKKGEEVKDEGGEKNEEEKESEEKDGEESMEDEEEGAGTEEEEGEDTADDVSQDESQDGENPDDVSNLQLAWEMLELAKLIYSKDESKEAQLRTAESHLKLGEVSMETEQYEEAIKDFTSCLTIQKEILEADNRLLAETYYQLGLANCFAKKFTESVESYQAAIKCIESRIKKLDEVLAKATPEEKESKDFDSPVYKANKEVNDLKELLPDIKSKIDDCEDERKNMDELKNLAKEALGGLAASVAPAKTDGETSQEEVKTTDISHLIKRKRKSEDTEGDSTKKARQEDGTGDAPSVTNGHSEKVVEKDESKETVESTS